MSDVTTIQWQNIPKRVFSFVLFSLLAIAVCVKLGLWQLSRAQDKQALLDIDQVTLTSLDQANSDSLHRKISLSGFFNNHTPILLDNQTHNKQFGYHLYLPFQSSGQTILVNLGWLAGDPSRLTLPRIPTYSGRYQLTGTLSAQQGSPLLLGANINAPINAPLVVQRTDILELQTYLQTSLTPLLLQLDEDSTVGFIKTWNITVMPPAKHTAYAIQWFALASALTLCSGYWLRKYRTHDKNVQDKD